MRHLSENNHDDSAIVEAVLFSDDESSIQSLSSEHSGSVATWSKVVASAKAITPDLGDVVINSVMAEIGASAAQPVEHRRHSSNSMPNRWVEGGLAIATAACLILAVVLTANERAAYVADTKLNVAVTQPPAQEDVEHLTASPEVDTPTTYRDLSNTGVIRVAREHGGIRLSNRSSSETIHITTAVRLEAVSGNLRISSL